MKWITEAFVIVYTMATSQYFTFPAVDLLNSSKPRKRKNKFSFSFYFDKPSQTVIKVADYQGKPTLTIARGKHFLPLTFSEFKQFWGIANEINEKMLECKKVLEQVDSEEEENFKVVKKSAGKKKKKKKIIVEKTVPKIAPVTSSSGEENEDESEDSSTECATVTK